MLRQHIIPSIKAAGPGVGPIGPLHEAVNTLKHALAAIHGAESDAARASLARTLRLETMVSVRAVCDEAEAVCPAALWTLATYKELQFMDQNVE